MTPQTVTVTTHPCPVCQVTSQVVVNYDQFRRFQQEFMHVQEAFPDMSIDDRELLITGTHPACWVLMFGEEE